jgi:acetyl-CoA carboxylase / biotin carboxylase 1
VCVYVYTCPTDTRFFIVIILLFCIVLGGTASIVSNDRKSCRNRSQNSTRKAVVRSSATKTRGQQSSCAFPVVVPSPGSRGSHVQRLNAVKEPEQSSMASASDKLAEYVAAKQGRRVIRKVLIANNGMAATKAILSMRRWAYNELGDENAIKFVAMATPEDIGANAEFIRYADDFIEVPGGKNVNNYANVDLITEIAVREGVDGVWPGWGHASENPKLPTALKKNGIQFIGPTAPVMAVLGDKIAANILAQTAKVPSIPWSGDGLVANLTAEGTIPQETFDKAMVRTVDECLAAAERIGYPVMLKASEGGGGKGIRMSADKEQLIANFDQVKAEVPGSPMFMMQLCTEARHLEVQIVGDEHGNAVAFNGRDCSTQRRFQKIFEEGPPIIAKPEIFREMERAAQRLTQNIGYIGAGTVEYLYNAATDKYFFLELNPRLQVEHPVTEGITGVNMPATQLQVAMGIPLHMMPDVRRFYGRDIDGTDKIDFMNEEYAPIQNHVIAARITAENPDEGFKPTSGGIERVHFQSTPTVWGYFSVGANGGVHEFADSQFGHIFASGKTREEARKALVLALKGMVVRGEIRTAVEYLVKLLETPAFKNNTIDTSWLDGLIKARSIALVSDPHAIVLGAALFRAFSFSEQEESSFLNSWEKGQVSTQGIKNLTSFPVDIAYENTKYEFMCSRIGTDEFEMSLGSKKVTAKMRRRNDGTLVAIYGGETHEIDGLEEPLGLRMTLDSQTWLLPTLFDPSQLRTDVTGKLIRFLQEDGAEIQAGKPYAEAEAMKMVMPLIAQESGEISHAMAAGAVISAGDLLANITLKDPSKVKKIINFRGDFRIKLVEEPAPSKSEKLATAVDGVNKILDGFGGNVDDALANLYTALTEQDADGGARWEKATSIMEGIVQRFLAVEDIFQNKSMDSVMASLIKGKTGAALIPVLNQVRAHSKLKERSKLVLNLLLQAPTLPQRVIARGPISWADDHAPISDSFQNTIKKLSKLRGGDYGEVALSANAIIQERRLPSLDKRVAELRKILAGKKKLLRAWGEVSEGDMISLSESPTLAVDLLPSLFVDEDESVRENAMSVYARRVYRAHNILDVKMGDKALIWKFKFRTYPDDSPVRTGLLVTAKNMAEVEANFGSYIAKLKEAHGDATGPPVLHIAQTEQPDDGEWSLKMDQVCIKHKDELKALNVKFVNLLVYEKFALPVYRTWHQLKDYAEDPLYRGERPTVLHLLELVRLENYKLTRLPTINRDLHIYVGELAASGASRAKDMLLRRLAHSKDTMAGGLERTLDKALDALDIARMDSRAKGVNSTRIYINYLSEVEGEFGKSTQVLKEKVAEYISIHATRLLNLSVDEIELRFRVGSELTPVRIMGTSMSGNWLKVDAYREYLEPISGRAEQFCLLGQNGQDEACFFEPYPSAGPLQNKRAVARAIGTTYIYDFLGLIEKAMLSAWRKQIASIGSGAVPQAFFQAEEAVYDEKTKELTWTKDSVPGVNKIAMVAWRCTMKTCEYPEGREVVFVGNDCTFMSGSFGVKEDDFYFAVSQYARENHLPRVFLACNSGARIGLVDELKPFFKVAWNNDSNPGMGFKYLYLTEADYNSFPTGTVNAHKISEDGETRMKLTDIIGQVHGIGVENLRGSGMIAGEQSAAYDKAFTLSYISGRSVGIGAYLNRLGQRNIQMKNGPMILTGYLALNKLLGKEVYTSQDQLGGPQVMMPNGVSHLMVEDDQAGVHAIMRWLSYTPKTTIETAPKLPTADPINRKIEFMPTKTPYDPRHMLAGTTNPETGDFVSGFFDKDSWTETLPDWGKSVVVGRARLGGMPMGVISVETRLMEQRIPADPANPESRETVLAQAGQVWFPDSAHKTATAIRDFNKGENLPLMIFANWRGFSGGTRDMYGEILKFGAMIVDELREYKQPVFVYIPPNGELRGGAWVVVDPTINLKKMEMFADTESRGGILEPPGICEVKFRQKDQLATMHRIDTEMIELDKNPEVNKDAIKKRENTLMPMYTQVAHEFADLHDRSGRMFAKGVINGVVEWPKAREYFYNRLQRRLSIDAVIDSCEAKLGDDVKLSRSVTDIVKECVTNSGCKFDDDIKVKSFVDSNKSTIISAVMQEARAAKVSQMLSEIKALDADTISALKNAL